MKHLFSIFMVLAMALGFSAKAYNCPENLYFYVSNGSSTAFDKNQNVFTKTVDATADVVYGVIVNANVADWDEAHRATAFFANGKYGDIEVSGAETWTTVSEWGTGWSNGCYKFNAGKKYTITLTYANGTFTGGISVDGESPDNPDTPDNPVVGSFDTTKDYFIDASKCSWFFDGGAIITVWDGTTDVVCEKVAGSIMKFRPTAAGTDGVMYIKRNDPNSETVWNEYALKAPTAADHNMFTLNSDFKGGEWSVYATPKAWLISKNINDWSAVAMSEYVFDYSEETELYTVTVPADKLRSDDTDGNGFKIGFGALNNWDGYYGAVVENKVLGKGIAADAAVGSAAKNFILPTAATTPVKLTFSAKEKKLTADWDIQVIDPIDPINPEDTEDVLKAVVPRMDVNGPVAVDVVLESVTGKNYCTGQWNISVPAGFTVSDITLNKERCTNHELQINVVDGVTKCIVYSPNNTPFVNSTLPLFSFNIAAENPEVGEVEGLISNILFSIPPKDSNLNITSRFADTPLNISVVKAVTKITADPANLALSTGASEKINLTIEPADATDRTVTWEVVSGENIIALADDGTVTAKAAGVATIKVTANDGFGATVSIDVTVDGKKVEKIELSATEHTMYVGDTMTLTATVTPDDATNKGVMWVSSDDNVATVNAEGVVTGMSAGEATIYAIAKDGSDVQATCAVTIKAKVSGDADGDDVLTIQDIVIIVKRVVDIITEGSLIENMDMDGDGVITVTDVTLAVYYLNRQEMENVPANAQMSTNMVTLSAPVAMGGNIFNIPFSLDKASTAAGLQFDIELPEGLEVTAESYVAPDASNNHKLSASAIGDNKYRVVIYSAYNFNRDELGYITVKNNANVEGNVEVNLSNIMFSDGSRLSATEASRVVLNIQNSGIDAIYGDDANAKHDVYNTAGVLVAPQADKATVKTLPAGIYVIGNTKVAVF